MVDSRDLRLRYQNPRRLVGSVTSVWLMEEHVEDEQVPKIVEVARLEESEGS